MEARDRRPDSQLRVTGTGPGQAEPARSAGKAGQEVEGLGDRVMAGERDTAAGGAQCQPQPQLGPEDIAVGVEVRQEQKAPPGEDQPQDVARDTC